MRLSHGIESWNGHRIVLVSRVPNVERQAGRAPLNAEVGRNVTLSGQLNCQRPGAPGDGLLRTAMWYGRLGARVGPER